MRARLTFAVNGNTLPEGERHLRDIDLLQKAETVGEGDTWETAKAAALAQLPTGALGLAWYRE